MGFTMAEKNKIRAEYARRYRKAKKTEKTKILDEYLKLLSGATVNTPSLPLIGRERNSSALSMGKMSMSLSQARLEGKGSTRSITTMR